MFNINYRRVTIAVALGSLLLMFIILTISTYQLKKSNASLQDHLITTNKKIASLELEFNTFKTLTSNEFESTWRSFATVRNNFLAIGHGFHLEERDFPPDYEEFTVAKEMK